jgi:tryptophan synthase beta subunit
MKKLKSENHDRKTSNQMRRFTNRNSNIKFLKTLTKKLNKNIFIKYENILQN